MMKEQKSFQNYYRFCISVVCVIGLLWNCLISACAAETIETEILYVKMKDDNTYMVSGYDAGKRAGKEAAIYIRQNANVDSDTTWYPVSEIAEDLCNNTGDMTTKNTDSYVFHYMDIKASEGLVIGNRAFRRNMVGAVPGDSLAPYVKIDGNTVAKIGQEAFYGSLFYCSFTVDAPVTLIDQEAFATAHFYKKPVLFHGAIDTIGTQAFDQALFHNGLAFYGGVKTIKPNAFQNATIIADNRDAESALYGTALQLNDVEDIQAGAFTGAKVQNGAIVILGDVKRVGTSAFEGVEFSYYTDAEVEANRQIPLGFVLSDSISEIGVSAFAASGVTMTSITMPESLKTIGADAFKGWDALTSVTLNSNITTMEEGALPDNEGMKIYLPDDLSDVSGLNLTSYTNAVVVVNETAVDLQELLQKADCKYEIKASEGEQNSQDGENTGDSSSSSTVVIDQSVTNNDYSDNSITNNTVNNNTVINNMFNGDASDTNVGNVDIGVQSPILKKDDTFTLGKLKYKVLTSKTAAFIGLNNKTIKTLTIPEQVKVGSQTFKITEIQKKACYNNKTLTAIVVGDNVTAIKASAFAGCTKVRSISLGTSVKTIGEKTFARDTKLKKITIKGKKLKSIGKNSFSGVPKTIEIRAPKSKIKAYTKMINKV